MVFADVLDHDEFPSGAGIVRRDRRERPRSLVGHGAVELWPFGALEPLHSRAFARGAVEEVRLIKAGVILDLADRAAIEPSA